MQISKPNPTTAEISWIKTLLTELKVPFRTPVIFCDNQSDVAPTHNLVLHARTKHMEIDIFFVRENVFTKQLVVHPIPALDQWANALTKPLSPTRFIFLRGKLNVVDTLIVSTFLSLRRVLE